MDGRNDENATQLRRSNQRYGDQATRRLSGRGLRLGHESDPSIVAASAAAGKAADATPARGPSQIDVKGLLDRNACLSCHAVDHKVVGPAYHDVAQKYAGDPQALAKIEASIRQGGAGKWGAVAMPPFATLSDPDLKALAEFVMRQ